MGNDPTYRPTRAPTRYPTHYPTHFPTRYPTLSPTRLPTIHPTHHPSSIPTSYPTSVPTLPPTESPLELFAIIGGSNCASQLDYGPASLLATGSDDGHEFYVSTSTASAISPHTDWLQLVTTDGETEIFRVYWTFRESLTLEERFVEATARGQDVSHRVVVAETGQEYAYTGEWWFSSAANITSFDFSRNQSDCCFSNGDGGVWGAGQGVLNGNNAADFNNTLFWGQGNWGTSNDVDCRTIYMNGIPFDDYGNSTKSYMYYYPGQPTSQPSSHPSSEPSAQPSSQPSSQPTAQPSCIPSSQPSSLPTGQPTGQPSNVPSSQPSMQPSSEPSAQPSSQPSSQPTAQPSCIPSSQPSSLPTGQPTGQPSNVPSSQPSMQPSSEPSAQPSSQPSSQPTAQPSCIPSSQPSSLPTGQPTGQPSNVPSSQPSMQPSSEPSAQPSSQPSCQPTSQPTSHPSSQPTAHPSSVPSANPSSQPSSQPSSFPSARPTVTPSSLPSSQPTSQPSAQPSTVPTVRPTSSQPTTVPSAAPSKFPTTSSPTKNGDTNPPTSYPTTMPTYNLDFSGDTVFSNHSMALSEIAATPDSFTHGTFYYKGVTPLSIAPCLDWTSYVDNELQLPLDDIQFHQVRFKSQYENFADDTVNSVDTTCSSPGIVLELLASLQSRTPYEGNCDGHTWRVFECSGAPVLCVDCKQNCVTTESCPGTSFVVNPCETCTTHASASAIVNFAYETVVFYPELLLPMKLVPSRTSIAVSVNTTAAGNVYCAALPTGFTVQYVLQIRDSAVSSQSSRGTNVSLVISNLNPDTAYDVYCYSEDFAYHIMPLAEALETKTAISTSCCRAIEGLDTHPTIVQYFANNTRPESIFTIELDSAPTLSTTVNLDILLVDCVTNALLDGAPTGTVVSPASFAFTSSSASLTGSFVVRGTTTGCYVISATSSGIDYYDALNISFSMLNAASIPSAPILSSVMLSNAGDKLFIDFNSNTDRGSTVITSYASSFACSGIVAFPSSNEASCQWTSKQRLVALILDLSVNVNIGDIVTLLSDVVKADCIENTVCADYAYVAEDAMNISAPAVPLSPTASLYSSSIISSCDTMSLDPTASKGYAGREWTSVRWTVEGIGIAQNARAIETLLNENYTNTDTTVRVDNALLTPSTASSTSGYKVTLTVTNFLGGASTASTTSFIDSGLGDIVPQLRLFGTNSITLRWKPLSIFAAVVVPECLGNSTISLVYTWRIYRGIEYLPSLVSTSLDQRYFKLPAYTLEASTTYTITCTLYSDPTSTTPLTLIDGKLQVGESGVTAVISGGSTRTVSNQDAVVLDASESMDIDYPTTGVLNYTWSCQVFSPEFGDPCTDFNGGSMSTVTLASSAMLPKVYSITCTVTNDAGKQSTASLELTVVEGRVPLVGIVAVEDKYNVNDKVVLTAEINSSLTEAWAEWSSSSFSSLNTAGVAVTPLSRNLTDTFTVFELAIGADSLVAGLTYSFTVRSSYVGSSNGATALASVDIVMNEAPRGGTLLVSPQTGTASSTVYSISAPQWQDDDTDLPLIYTLAYYFVNPYQLNMVKGPDELSYVDSVLGQGLEISNYVVYVSVQVHDVFNARANSSTTTTVLPPQNVAEITALTESALSASLSNENPTAVTQVVGATLSSINTVNCSVPRDCSSINREVCQKTAMICGPCLTGYIGVEGDSNIACNTSASLLPVGGPCGFDDECITGSCVIGECADVSKSCAGNCSDAGSCVFVDLYGDALASCSITDNSCRAKCLCDADRFGLSCAVNASDYAQLLALRETLCYSLYQLMAYQDVTAEVIGARTYSISNVLIDIDQISDAALYNCTAALVETVLNHPVLSCSGGSGLALVTGAMSSVLELGQALPSELLTNVSRAMVALSEGCQSSHVLGESPLEIENANIRMLSSIVSNDGLASSVLEPPQSQFEQFNGEASSSVGVNNLTSSDSTGVSLVVYKNNPQGASSNSTQVGVKLTDYSSESSNTTAASRRYRHRHRHRARRQLQNVDSSTGAGAVASAGLTIVLINREPIDYSDVPPSTLLFSCLGGSTPYPYFLNGTCPNGQVLNMTCSARGEFNISCPQALSAPECSFFDGVQYSVDPDCTVVDYTPHNTTCYCRAGTTAAGSDDTGRRILQTDESGVTQYSTVFAVVGTEFAETFTSTPSLSDIRNNPVIMSYLCGIVFLYIVGWIVFSMWDKEDKRLADERRRDTSIVHARTIAGFFDLIVPPGIHGGPWHQRFWKRLQKEHNVVRLFVPYNGKANRTIQWTSTFGLFLIVVFLNSVVGLLLYADSGYCEDFTTQVECEDAETPGGFFDACVWSPDAQTCSFVKPVLTVPQAVIIVLVITCFTVPLDQVWEYFLNKAVDFFHRNRCHVQSSAEGEDGDGDGEDADDVQQPIPERTEKEDEFKSLLTQEAQQVAVQRLERMLASADDATMEEESLIIKSKLELREQVNVPVAITVTANSSTGTNSHGLQGTRYELQLHHDKIGNIHKFIKEARRLSSDYCHHINRMDVDEIIEQYLMLEFIHDIFTGHKRNIISKFLLGSTGSVRRLSFVKLEELVSVILLPCYAGVMLYFILVFAISIGAKSTDAWLLLTNVVILQVIFIVQPMKIFVLGILIHSPVTNEVRHYCKYLTEKAPEIYSRALTVADTDHNNLVQHLNPACRAARRHPHLPVSQMLQLITDADIPREREKSILFAVPYLMFSAFLVFVTGLPAVIQDTVFKVASSTMLNFTILAMSLLFSSSFVGAVLLLIVLGLLFFLIIAKACCGVTLFALIGGPANGVDGGGDGGVSTGDNSKIQLKSILGGGKKTSDAIYPEMTTINEEASDSRNRVSFPSTSQATESLFQREDESGGVVGQEEDEARGASMVEEGEEGRHSDMGENGENTPAGTGRADIEQQMLSEQ